MTKKTARKMIFSFVFLAIASILGLNSSVYAATGVLTVKSVSLTDSQASVNTSYALSFKTATAGTLTEIDFQFATKPSGSITVPSGFGVSSPALTASSNIGTGWTLDTSNAASGLIKLTNPSAQSVAAAQQASVTISGITNSSMGACSGGSTTDTCYVRISTYQPTTTLVDQGSASYTITTSVQATATVDPSFTMTVGGVNNATLINEGSSSATTTAATTYQTLPFGNIQANQSAIVAQTLTVTTNAIQGFTVKNAMTTQMQGTANTANKIAPFYGNSATYATPVAWAAPTGSAIPTSASDSTPSTTYASYLGMNTTDSSGLLPTFNSGANMYFAPLNSTYNAVQESNAPVQAKTVDVIYQLETDVYMPADTYQGTLEYNAVANY